MHRSEWLKLSCSSLMMAALILQPAASCAQDQHADGNGKRKKLVEIAPKSSRVVAHHTL